MELAVYMPEQEPQLGHVFFLKLAELFRVDLARTVGAHGLEHARKAGLFPADAPGEHRPAAHEDGREVQPGRGHEQAGHVLVAVGEHDQPVKPVREHHRLRRVAIRSRVTSEYFMPRCPHGDAVAHRDGGEHDRGAARHATPSFTASVSLSRCMCPGTISLNELTTPMSGRDSSSRVRPSAW